MSEKSRTPAEQLQAVQTGSSAGNSISRAGRTHDALYGACVAVLIALMLAVVVFVYPTRVSWLVVVSTLLYGVGIGVVGAIYRQRRTGTSRVTGRRIRMGFVATISLYGIGVALAVLRPQLPDVFWIPYIVATALPLLVVSGLRAPRDR